MSQLSSSHLWNVSHLFVVVFLWEFSSYLLNPVLTDVFVDALCTHQTHTHTHTASVCSTALYLTGIQQAIIGLGSTILLPVLGNLSDVYGRKKFLLIPLSLAIIPTAILSWQRTTNFFYAYYAFKCLTGMLTGAVVICIALAHLADNVPQEMRVSAFGILSGVISAANLSSAFAARFLSTPQIFQVATAVSIVAVVYTIAFLKESSYHNHSTCNLEQPILNRAEPRSDIDEAVDSEELSQHVEFMRSIPSLKSILCLLKSSTTFSLLACVTFFNGLAETAGQTFILYYLKARFQFSKDQFAEILLIVYAGATVSSTFFIPVAGPLIGEEGLLILGLFGGFLHMFIDSIAWSAWVSYASASLGFLFAFVDPTLRSIVSRLIGPDTQGIAQGCILGIASSTSITSPLIFTPLSAMVFPEADAAAGAPTGFPGLSIFCIALVYLIAFAFSIFIKIIPRFSRGQIQIQC